jgi:hypothetical protein
MVKHANHTLHYAKKGVLRIVTVLVYVKENAMRAGLVQNVLNNVTVYVYSAQKKTEIVVYCVKVIFTQPIAV